MLKNNVNVKTDKVRFKNTFFRPVFTLKSLKLWWKRFRIIKISHFSTIKWPNKITLLFSKFMQIRVKKKDKIPSWIAAFWKWWQFSSTPFGFFLQTLLLRQGLRFWFFQIKMKNLFWHLRNFFRIRKNISCLLLGII